MPRDVRPSIRLLLDRLPNSIAFVLAADFEILAWNTLAAAALGDLTSMSTRERNIARWRFLGGGPADAVHRVVGPITVNCDGLDIADLDQRVIIYTADPGSRSEEALRLLSVVGTQNLASRG